MATQSIIGSLTSRLVTFGSALVLFLALYTVAVWIYNVLFHPLREFPGPKFAAASPVPHILAIQSGRPVQWIASLHAKYGEVVRFSPNELSFSGAGATKDIYGYRKSSPSALPKTAAWYIPPAALNLPTRDIINADDADHTRVRRIFSHAFSDRALKLQEPLFLTYVDTLIRKLGEQNGKVELVKQLNFATFDIMSDLTFGEPLGMLEKSDYHPWVATILASFQVGAIVQVIRYYPLLLKGLLSIIPKSTYRKFEMLDQFSTAHVDKRVEKTDDSRPDIWGLVLKRDDEKGMSRAEMYANAKIFMVAGTETTATLLSGLFYYLLANTAKMQGLVDEIRGAFASEDEITIEKLQGLKYLFACLEEALRMYPPVPFGLPRTVPVGGVEIDGYTVPAGATVSVHHYSAYRNPNNFTSPDSFIPERWTSPDYASDKKAAFNPFSSGPRNCLGKNLAYHEMRVIVAKLLWHFDMHLCEESRDWADQDQFLLWNKKPLMVRLTPVKRDA